MRINRLIQLGRLEIYIGSGWHSPPRWDAFPTAHGYELHARSWKFIAEWVPRRKSDAQIREELLALAREHNAKALGEGHSAHVDLEPPAKA